MSNVFEITDPTTNKTYRIEADDGVTQEQALEQFQSLPQESWVDFEYAPEPSTDATVESLQATQTPSVDVAPPAAPTEVSNNLYTATQMKADTLGDYENYEITPLSPEDESTYVRLSEDPNVSFEELRNWAAERNVYLGPEAEENLTNLRQAISEGRPVSREVAYERLSSSLLGYYTPEIDPMVENDFAAVLERGMAYNPMGLVTRGLEDLFNIEQGGVDKDALRQQYPDLSEDQIEELHDNLIGEMRRRELINANYQTDVRDVNPVLGFVGDVVGGASPVDLIPIGRAATVGRRLAVAGGANFAVDAALQAGDIAYGAQQQYDPVQGAIAVAAGTALQGGFEALGAGVNKVLRTTPNAPAPAPTGAPIVVPTARKGTKAYATQIKEVQQRISEQVNELTNGWTNLPEVEVFDTFKGVQGLDNKGIAVYSTKTLDDGTVVPVIRINSEALLRTAARRKVSPESLVEAATFHEALGHHGLLSVFDKDLDAFLDDIYINGETKFREQVDDWLKKNPKAYDNFPPVKRRILATEELLAEASEKGPIARRKLDGLANYLKDFARTRMGMNLKYSQREIRSYLAVAHGRTMKGQRAEAAPAVNKNMMADQAPATKENVVEDFLDALVFSPVNKFEEIKQGGQSYYTSLVRFLDDPKARANYTPEQAELADKLIEAIPNDVRVDVGNSLFSWRDSNVLGYADFSPGDTFRNPPSVVLRGDGKRHAATALHEAVHVAFIERYGFLFRQAPENMRQPVEQLKKIYDVASKKWNASSQYGMTNLDEFVAELFTNKKFQDWLKGENLWTKAVNIVRKILGLPEKNFNLLSDAMDAGNSLLKQAKDQPLLRGQDLLEDQSSDSVRYMRGDDLPRSANDNKPVRPEMPPREAGDKALADYYAASSRYNIQKAQEREAKGRSGDNYRNSAKLDIKMARRLDPETYGEMPIADRAKHFREQADYYQKKMNERAARGDAKGLERNRLFRDDARDKASRLAELALQDRTPSAKYMRGDEGRIEDQNFDGRMTMILRELQDEYVPTQRSQAEAQRAARIAGLRSRQYKGEKGLEDLDIRLFQYEAVNERYQARLLRITDRMAVTKAADDLNGYVRASDEFKKVLYEYKALSAKIQNDQAQIARALNAMKALSLTKRNIADTLSLMDGNKLDADALNALDDPATLDALAKMMSAQIQAGNTLGAAKVAEKVGKPYWWQYALSYLHLSMLSGLGTHAVNAYDAVNVLGRKLEERLIGGAIGTTRRVLGAKDTMSAMEGLGFTYGIIRALVDADTYKNAYRAFKEGYEFQPFDARIERQDARIPYLSKINDALYASDMFWRAFHMSANMYSLGLRKAFKDGFRGKELFEETYANVVNADKELFDEAKRHANEALLVDTPSAFTSWLEAGKNIKPNMTAGQQARAFTLNLLFPFLRVSDRLVFQALKRVPLVAFLDHNSRREWGMGGAARDAVMARQLMGGALISYYWMMADPENQDQEGYIEGYGPENYQERMGLEATGYRPETVVEEDQVMRNANQINVTANPFNTRNNVAVLVASIRQQWEQSKKTDKDANEVGLLLTSAMRAGGTFLLKQGYAGNVTPYVEALEAGPRQEGAVAALGGDLASRAVPAAVRQFNQMYFDPIKRDTSGDKSVGDRVLGRVQSSIPGLSDLMPANLTALGEEQEQGRTLLRLGDGTEIIQGDPYTELRRLERETEEPLLTEFRGSFTYEGENIKLNAVEKNKWQAIQGQYLRDVMVEWVTSEDWAEMSDVEKVDVVKDIKEEAYEYAKEQLLDEVLTARGK